MYEFSLFLQQGHLWGDVDHIQFLRPIAENTSRRKLLTVWEWLCSYHTTRSFAGELAPESERKDGESKNLPWH
jgi:hypothetical protein